MAKKPLIIATVIALVGALVPALVALRMMAENNNNGELYDTVTGRWDVGYALSVSAVFYVPSFLLIFVVAFALTRLGSSGTGR